MLKVKNKIAVKISELKQYLQSNIEPISKIISGLHVENVFIADFLVLLGE